MNAGSDSVYPELLKAGLETMGSLGAHRELEPLFAALEYLRRELHGQKEPEGILRVAAQYVLGLNLCHTAGFCLVNPVDRGFDLAFCTPRENGLPLQGAVDAAIRDGRFAWALRQASPVFFQYGPVGATERGILHTLAVPNQVLGMFCGLLKSESDPTREIAFNLLSVLLGVCADSLFAQRKSAELTHEILTLSGLMPICAWCKKIRDDRGYWEQLEAYLQAHSGATFSHGICPECEAKFLTQIPGSIDPGH